MPNVRDAGLVPLSFRLQPELLAGIDEGRSLTPGMDRSQFIRDAIATKLAVMGIDYKPGSHLRPDRVGKGGRRKLVYKIKTDAWTSNEKGPA